MTRKDYILIAKAIKDASSAPGFAARNSFVTHALADALAKDNPRFDRDRFMKACGVQSWMDWEAL